MCLSVSLCVSQLSISLNTIHLFYASLVPVLVLEPVSHFGPTLDFDGGAAPQVVSEAGISYFVFFFFDGFPSENIVII